MSNRHSLKKTPRNPKAISRLGGSPIGIGVDNWPHIRNPETDKDQPMIHVLTVATADLDGDFPADVMALALFVACTSMPMYFDDPTSDYTVVRLTKADIKKGELEGPELPEQPMSAHGLSIGRTKSKSSSNFAGGRPHYLQDDAGSRGFVLQLNERFAALNLGDSGELYMFTNWAMWQSC